jgi:hypothetical protein
LRLKTFIVLKVETLSLCRPGSATIMGRLDPDRSSLYRPFARFGLRRLAILMGLSFREERRVRFRCCCGAATGGPRTRNRALLTRRLGVLSCVRRRQWQGRWPHGQRRDPVPSRQSRVCTQHAVLVDHRRGPTRSGHGKHG